MVNLPDGHPYLNHRKTLKCFIKIFISKDYHTNTRFRKFFLSIKHDQLVTLNDAMIGTQSLYNGLDVSITKNVFHWNNVDLQHFLTGEEVVCGVGTISPRFVLGDYVYWWRGCLGGAGISQPGEAKYEETIRCVQAEDVIQRYFGMQ